MYEKLSQVIKSEIAIRAIKHVINQAEQFNNDYFPVKVDLIGIGGSSIRVSSPKDIDILIKAQAVKEIWEEFIEFKKHLDKNFGLFIDTMYEISERKGRATIKDILEVIQDDLLKLGFKKVWIEKWLPWMRITDIRHGINIGLPHISFDVSNLLLRYIKRGWHGRRLEIHVYVTDPTGSKRDLSASIPFLIVWKAQEGVVLPSEREVFEFYREEYDKLAELSRDIWDIIKGLKNTLHVPRIYHHTLNLIIDKRENSYYKRTEKELRKLAIAEITKIRNIVEHQKIVSIEKITELRQRLKRFALVGLIYDKIKHIEIFQLVDVFGSGNPVKSLSGILHKRLKRYKFWKKDIENVLRDFDIRALYADLKDIVYSFKLSKYLDIFK